jgi:hypothetical protein
MGVVLAAVRAELAELQALGRQLLVLGLAVILPLALSALEGNDLSRHDLLRLSLTTK